MEEKMIRLNNRFGIAALVAVAALALTSTFAAAQTTTTPEIFVVGGGRTTLTISPILLNDLTKIGAAPTSVAGSELVGNQIFFPISTGSFNFANANGELLHTGGITLTTMKTQVRMTAFLLNTIGEDDYVTALVEVNGKFQGRVKVFDLTLPSELKLPIVPSDGEFFVNGVNWSLDPDGAAALNDAFATDVFSNSMYIGYSQMLVFTPLTADGI
jgi:hypothetical protein